MKAQNTDSQKWAREFLDARISHYQLDGGNLVVAHAGMKEQYIGRTSGRVREFALYGDTTGEVDDEGLPVRLDWAAEYRGKASIVYGHTVVDRAQWLNNTICIDTGCCFGGKLTALRWPEREIVDVPAKATYVENPRKKAILAANAQQANDLTLDLADVLGKRIVDTRLSGNVTIREENAAAALEVISRFAVDPRWLIYLPPTMSPCATSEREGYLEHPDEAFRYFAENGVAEVVCEEKHMGSRSRRHRLPRRSRRCRAIRHRRRRRGRDHDAHGPAIFRRPRDRGRDSRSRARRRSCRRAVGGTRDDVARARLRADAVECEGPRPALASIRRGRQRGAGDALANRRRFRQAATRSPELLPKLDRVLSRQHAAERYVQSYQRYCWDVVSIDDYKLAPFHLLASEGAVHADKPHAWHMTTLARLERAPTIIATRHRFVRLDDAVAREAATQWWVHLTEAGGEGMVVKPADFTTLDSKGRLIQPAVKCRGREYLRIIYGPEYDLPDNLSRLRKRGLAGKRSMAAREFALGIEGLERFVRREPLRRVHECAFGVLAMESEPVDPRL